MIAATGFESSVSVWTIRGALVCMVFFFAIRIWSRNLEKTALEAAKSLWLIGSLLSLLHAIATMAFHHQFQHSLAYEDIANKTEQALGLATGFGIWLNYLFVVVWILDALWINGFTKSYLNRSRVSNWWVYGFLVFIAFNGAVVFETGPVRWISIVAIVVLLFGWKKREP